MERLLSWSAVGLTGASMLVVASMWARRAVLSYHERARRAAEERARPLAVALVEGERIEPHQLTAGQARALARVLERLSRQVTGEARRRIAVFFQTHGFVLHELLGLRSRRSGRRALAAFALGDMGSARATDALVEALADRSADVRGAAARSLGRLGAVSAVEPLVLALVARRVARPVASQALAVVGAPAVPALRRLCADARPEVRLAAVELLGRVGGAADADVLAGCLRDGSAEVRARAIRALGRLGAADVTAELRAALADPVFFVRVAAAHALGAIGDRESAPALLELARADRAEVAAAAARAAAGVAPGLVLEAAGSSGAGPFLHEAADLLELRRR
jgi:HEAT repeat protein